MLFLIFAVLCGASLSFCFKIFKKMGIDSLQCIFFNYLTAIAVSIFLNGADPASIAKTVHIANEENWLLLAIIEGFFFMGGFLVMAASTHRAGVAITNVSARASMVIPVVASYLIYKEAAPSWFALVLMLVAMVMIFGQAGSGGKLSWRDWILPVGVMLEYGICDFLLKVLRAGASAEGQGGIMLFIFTTAAISCGVCYLIRGNFRDHGFSWKSVPGGILLGLLNSGCTALMLKALGQMDAVLFYPLYNAGVVFLSLVAGIIFFKEKLRGIQIGGILLATLSIVLMLSL